MPKKTKREKRIAEQRRIHSPPLFKFTAQISEPTSVPVAHALNGDLALIQKDLLKTILLAIFAISSEVILAKIIR